MKKYLWLFIFLVSWKIETCGDVWSNEPGKITCDEYEDCHGDKPSMCEVTTFERRKFFKTEHKVIKFIENAPSNASDFKVQEFGDNR